jgi:NAD(P)H-nitrite reductase large subunit
MQRYVIVGNGVAGIEAAFQIRARRSPSEASITVIGSETDYFFSRTALMYAFMDVMDRRDLEPHERGTYDRQQIQLVRDHVTDLDANSKTLCTRSGRTLEYDRLLLAVGARPRMFDWNGVESIDDGIVHFVSMQDLDACERLTPSTEHAVVIGGGLIGIELVECLMFHGVSTTFLVREPYFWPMALSEAEGEMVSDHIREHGVDLRHSEEMVEVFADDDGRVREVLTDNGNRIPCQMLGIAVGVVSNNEFLRTATTSPDIDRGIVVDRSFRTTLPDVWAAGDCCEIDVGEGGPLIETIWYSARLHGQLAARSMVGDDVRYEPPLFYNSSKFFEIEYTTVGRVVNLPDGTMSLFRRHPTKEITQRIVYDDMGRVLGFNMLGSRWDHTILERWIHERRHWSWVREHLHEAQFDVEFGRAKLETFEEREIPV